MNTKRIIAGALALATLAAPVAANAQWRRGGWGHGGGGAWHGGGGAWNGGYGYGYGQHWHSHNNTGAIIAGTALGLGAIGLGAAIVGGGYGGYYRPPVYYAQPPVYYAPPPVVYAPQPPQFFAPQCYGGPPYTPYVTCR